MKFILLLTLVGQLAQAAIPTLSSIKVASSIHHSCAILENGGAACYGSNSFGQLGVSDSQDRAPAQAELLNFGTHRKVLDLAVGETHSCALLDNHKIKCWGDGFFGQLGQGNRLNYGSTPELAIKNMPYIDLGSGQQAQALSVNRNHSCALLMNGQIKCWGKGTRAQLGYESQTNKGDTDGQMGNNLPVVPLGGRRAIRLYEEGIQTCTILDNQTKKCWGNPL